MPDLYAALDIERGAPPEAVRAAYRKAAKRAHPDGGGSPEQFALVRKAHDVLLDEKRRRKYDATGQAEETEPDNTLSQVMVELFGLLEAVTNEIARRGRAFEEFDLVRDAIATGRNAIVGIEQQIYKNGQSMDLLRKMARRFKAKKKHVNRISPLLEGHVRTLEHGNENLRRKKTHVEEAIKILDEHTFDFEQVARGW